MSKMSFFEPSTFSQTGLFFFGKDLFLGLFETAYLVFYFSLHAIFSLFWAHPAGYSKP